MAILLDPEVQAGTRLPATEPDAGPASGIMAEVRGSKLKLHLLTRHKFTNCRTAMRGVTANPESRSIDRPAVLSIHCVVLLENACIYNSSLIGVDSSVWNLIMGNSHVNKPQAE